MFCHNDYRFYPHDDAYLCESCHMEKDLSGAVKRIIKKYDLYREYESFLNNISRDGWIEGNIFRAMLIRNSRRYGDRELYDKLLDDLISCNIIAMQWHRRELTPNEQEELWLLREGATFPDTSRPPLYKYIGVNLQTEDRESDIIERLAINGDE